MELAEIIREYGPAFLEKYGAGDPQHCSGGLLPSQRRAMDSIIACRTPQAGLMTVLCPHCGKIEQHAHSCGHRNCPKCQNHETGAWIERQLEKLLPVPYFLVTVTVSGALRDLAWNHQRVFYGAMFDASADALRTLGRNERYLGGDIGMIGVLHTNGRRLQFHPHIHYLVPAGAIDVENRFWKRKAWRFLFPEKALARLFRGKLRAILREKGLDVPQESMTRDWVVKVKDVGTGTPALKYLGRYLYRGVISEKRIVENRNGNVGFLYVESETGKLRKRVLPGEDFIRLVLQHVLPRGFRRARGLGFLHGNAKKTLRLVQLLLRAKVAPRTPTSRPVFTCPACGANMRVIHRRERITGKNRSPPCSPTCR